LASAQQTIKRGLLFDAPLAALAGVAFRHAAPFVPGCGHSLRSAA